MLIATLDVARRARDRAILALVARVVLLSILYRLGLAAFQEARKLPVGTTAAIVLAAILVAVAVAARYRDLRWHQVWPPLRLLMRGCLTLVSLQLACDALHPAALFSNLFLGLHADARIVAGIGLGCAIAAVWRASFALPALLAYAGLRMLVAAHYRLPMPQLDVRTVSDIGLFTTIALLAWIAARRQRGDPAPSASDLDGLRVQKLLWALSVGIHLGNYFQSGLAKLKLGGADPLFWVLHNPTSQPLVIGMFRWNTPVAGWPGLVEQAAGLLGGLAVPINLFVLAIQLGAPLSVINRRVMIAFTLAFDVMHLAIYGSLGAFFFFWIALNVLILLSLRRMTDAQFTPAMKVTAAVTACFGWMSFSIASLGWLDGQKIVREIFVAHYADGSNAAVPPALFGPVSYQLAHGELWVPAGHFKVRNGGNVRHRREWDDASRCGPAVIAHAQKAPQSLASVTRLAADMDRYHRAHPWVRGWGLAYLYPHHSPSNPAFFRSFDARPLAAVVGYDYVVQSACPRLAGGRLDDDVRIQSSFPLDLAQERGR